MLSARDSSAPGKDPRVTSADGSGSAPIHPQKVANRSSLVRGGGLSAAESSAVVDSRARAGL